MVVEGEEVCYATVALNKSLYFYKGEPTGPMFLRWRVKGEG